ncbi:unnamed protein product [marine sediment metagenome]|uniref:PARP catalytic domain-containing protein n=1 Tax=marine sediment metagenome TaxID=412755 RepID=X0YCM3_9ZZZZ
MRPSKDTTPTTSAGLFTIPQECSWHFDRELKPEDKSVAGNYALIPAETTDIVKVLEAYSHHPVAGYDIASIEIVYNEQLNRLFFGNLSMMNLRHGNDRYQPKWKKAGDSPEKQHRLKVDAQFRALAKSHTDPKAPHVSLLPLWHGTNDDIAQDYIFNMGYGIFMANDPNVVTDEGYFGKGIYSAHEAEYSFRSYAQKHGNKAVLILNWVSSFEAYPVIDGDMDKLRGKALAFDQTDGHFIPVRSNQHILSTTRQRIRCRWSFPAVVLNGVLICYQKRRGVPLMLEQAF